MNPALVIQIITAALQLTPLAITTVAGVKQLLAADPSIPAELAKILNDTASDNAASLAAIQEWMKENPGA